jgi:hypothetical protein
MNERPDLDTDRLDLDCLLLNLSLSLDREPLCIEDLSLHVDRRELSHISLFSERNIQ